MRPPWMAVYTLTLLAASLCDSASDIDALAALKKDHLLKQASKTEPARDSLLENYPKDYDEDDSKLDLVLGRLVKLQGQLNSLRRNVETMCAPENLKLKRPIVLRVIEKAQCQPKQSETGIKYKIFNCGQGTSRLGYFFIANGTQPDNDHDPHVCTVHLPYTIPEKQYVAKVKLYNVNSIYGTYFGFPGIAFNIANEDNFDFVIIRMHSKHGCYQTGYMQNGELQFVGSESGACYRQPTGRSWFTVEIQVGPGEATLFLDGFKTASFIPHFGPIGCAGVIVKHGERNIIRFKGLQVAPFYKRQFNFFHCSTYHRISADYYRLDTKDGMWPSSGFCTALWNSRINATEYAINVNLFNQRGPEGSHESGRLGIMYNAQDENNYDFVFFRPEYERACYYTGYVQNSRVRWENAKIGGCAGGPFKGGAWNNVTIYVRDNNVVVHLEGRHVVSSETHFKSRPVGGVIVSNDNAINVISFKEFKINAITPADVTFHDCFTNTRVSNGYYLLDGNHGTWPNDTFCRAFSKKVLHGHSYEVSAEMFITEDKIYEKMRQYYGIAYNIRDALNYDFIVLRPKKDSCYNVGSVSNGVVIFEEDLKGKCPTGPPKKGSWFKVSVTVWDSMAVINLEERHVLTITPRFTNNPRGGVLVSNGNKNMLTFRNFKLHLIPPIKFELKRCGLKTDYINGTFLLHAERPYWPVNLFCTAMFKETIEISSGKYTIQVVLQNVDSYVGAYLGNPGVMFNALDHNTFDYVYLRLHNKRYCFQFGTLVRGHIVELRRNSGSCGAVRPEQGGWFRLTVKMNKREAKLFIDDVYVGRYSNLLPAKPKGGVIVPNGFKNTILFRDFKLS